MFSEGTCESSSQPTCMCNVLMVCDVAVMIHCRYQALLRSAGTTGYNAFKELIASRKVPIWMEVSAPPLATITTTAATIPSGTEIIGASSFKPPLDKEGCCLGSTTSTCASSRRRHLAAAATSGDCQEEEETPPYSLLLFPPHTAGIDVNRDEGQPLEVDGRDTTSLVHESSERFPLSLSLAPSEGYHTRRLLTSTPSTTTTNVSNALQTLSKNDVVVIVCLHSQMLRMGVRLSAGWGNLPKDCTVRYVCDGDKKADAVVNNNTAPHSSSGDGEEDAVGIIKASTTTTTLPGEFMSYSPAKFVILEGLNSIANIPNKFMRNCSEVVSLEWRREVASSSWSSSPSSAVVISKRKIGSSFMSGCSSLVSIDLSQLLLTDPSNRSSDDGVVVVRITLIGDRFLENCFSLESVDLSPLEGAWEESKEVSDRFLSGCASLRQINLNPLRHVNHIRSNFLSDCVRLESLDLSPLVEVTVIQSYFLKGCTGLKSLKMFPPMHQVDRRIFIGDYFLSHCISLKEIDLSSLRGISSLSKGFLMNCTGLEEVNLEPLGESLQSIWYQCLFGCTSLRSVGGLAALTNVHVLDDFCVGCTGLTTFDLRIFASKTSLPAGLFVGCTNLTTLDFSPLSDSLLSIHDRFLEGCSSLESVDLSSLRRVCSIEGSFMVGCTSLRNVTLPPTLQENLYVFPDKTFEGCQNLKNVAKLRSKLMPKRMEELVDIMPHDSKTYVAAVLCGVWCGLLTPILAIYCYGQSHAQSVLASPSPSSRVSPTTTPTTSPSLLAQFYWVSICCGVLTILVSKLPRFVSYTLSRCGMTPSVAHQQFISDILSAFLPFVYQCAPLVCGAVAAIHRPFVPIHTMVFSTTTPTFMMAATGPLFIGDLMLTLFGRPAFTRRNNGVSSDTTTAPTKWGGLLRLVLMGYVLSLSGVGAMYAFEMRVIGFEQGNQRILSSPRMVNAFFILVCSSVTASVSSEWLLGSVLPLSLSSTLEVFIMIVLTVGAALASPEGYKLPFKTIALDPNSPNWAIMAGFTMLLLVSIVVKFATPVRRRI